MTRNHLPTYRLVTRGLRKPEKVGATGIEPAWSQPAHRTPNAQACAHALDQLHRLFDLEESW
jgi:hypothetical protein